MERIDGHPGHGAPVVTVWPDRIGLLPEKRCGVFVQCRTALLNKGLQSVSTM
jgi:hypothetical protein